MRIEKPDSGQPQAAAGLVTGGGIIGRTRGAAKADKPTSDKEDAALKKACREFESLLVAQMLHQMRATVPKADLFGSREKEEIFQSLLDDEVAKEISRTGTLKLADLIYAQLSPTRKR